MEMNEERRIEVTDLDRMCGLDDQEILFLKTKLRVKALQAMDFLARHSNHETCFEWWLQNGVEDGATEDDLVWYAQRDDVFDEVCESFVTMFGSQEMQEGGLYFRV